MKLLLCKIEIFVLKNYLNMKFIMKFNYSLNKCDPFHLILFLNLFCGLLLERHYSDKEDILFLQTVTS
jgi:hypothetical protein